MIYENAKRGVKMIYTAEILELIAVLLSSAAMTIKDVSFTTGIVGALAALVLVIVAAVKEIKGLTIAGKDEKGYKNALILVIVWFVATLLSAALPALIPSMKASPLEFGSDLINLLVLVSVIQATNVLLRNKGEEETVKKGNIALCVNVAALFISSALEAFIQVSELNDEKKVIAFVVTGLVYAVVLLVGYIKYLVYLKKASEKL